jgi:hypothetical protein
MARPNQRRGQSALRSQDLLAYYRQVSQSLLTVVGRRDHGLSAGSGCPRD